MIDSWLSGLAISAIKPLLALTGRRVLSTTDYTANPAVHDMWTGMLGVSDTLFLLLILAGGVILMGHQTYQGSYALREVAPRFAIAMVVSNTSLILTSKAIGLSNGISVAVSGGALPATATSTLTQILMQGAQGGKMLVLLALAAVIVAVIIAIIYVVRQMAMVLLIAMAPLALSGYALPHTSWAARWWWRALAALLAIPPAEALVLNAAMHVFFGPGFTTVNSLLAALCLLYVMARVPFWISRPVLSPFGRSPIRSTLRFAWGAAVLSRFGRALRGTSGNAARRSGPQRSSGATARTRPSAGRSGGQAGGGNGGPPDPGDGASPRGGSPDPRPPNGPGRPGPRHAAPPPLPSGDRPYSARHAAPPPLPADDRPTEPKPASSSGPHRVPPLPSAGAGASGRHAKPPPLPATRAGSSGKHAAPPPPPAGTERRIPPPLPAPKPERRNAPPSRSVREDRHRKPGERQ